MVMAFISVENQSGTDNSIEFVPEVMAASLYTNRLAFSEGTGLKFDSMNEEV